MAREVPNHKTIRHAPDEAFQSGRPVSSGLFTNINRELAFLHECLTGGPVPGNAAPTLDGSTAELSPHDHTGDLGGSWRGVPILRANLMDIFSMGNTTLPQDPEGHTWDFPAVDYPHICGVNDDQTWRQTYGVPFMADKFFGSLVMPTINDDNFYLQTYKRFRVRKGTKKLRLMVCIAYDSSPGTINLRILLKLANSYVFAHTQELSSANVVEPYWLDLGEIPTVPNTEERLPNDSEAELFVGQNATENGTEYLSLWIGGVMVYESA